MLLRPSDKKEEEKTSWFRLESAFSGICGKLFFSRPCPWVGPQPSLPQLPYNFAKWNKSSKTGGGVCTVSYFFFKKKSYGNSYWQQGAFTMPLLRRNFLFLLKQMEFEKSMKPFFSRSISLLFARPTKACNFSTSSFPPSLSYLLLPSYPFWKSPLRSGKKERKGKVAPFFSYVPFPKKRAKSLFSSVQTQPFLLQRDAEETKW